MKTTHTPTPWKVSEIGSIENDFEYVTLPSAVFTCLGTSGVHNHEKLALSNAQRIVECVNACAGIPSEDLKRCVDTTKSIFFRN